MAKAEWNVRAGNSDRPIPAAPGSVPLKWASDSATDAPRYIHDPEIVSQAASAVCPGCGSKLWTVPAGEPQRLRPTAHIRHVAGSPRTACVVVAARLAASHHLASLGYIDLPRRRVTAVSKGFSGEGYEGWVEEPAQRVRISDVRTVDPAAAELTLDDGRTILVDLTGERVGGEAGRAVMTINLSDPALAEMDVDELRARLRLLPPMKWCSHWRDRELASQARARAADEVRHALDAWTDEDEAQFQAQLPQDMDPDATAMIRRETLLHRTVNKDEDEQHDEFPEHWSETVLIEVAVTLRVDDEKLRKVRHLDLPTTEIDLGSMGGHPTLAGLRKFVVDGVEGKPWLHHPALRTRRAVLRCKLREHAEVLAYQAYTKGMPKTRQSLTWSAKPAARPLFSGLAGAW